MTHKHPPHVFAFMHVNTQIYMKCLKTATLSHLNGIYIILLHYRKDYEEI